MTDKTEDRVSVTVKKRLTKKAVGPTFYTLDHISRTHATAIVNDLLRDAEPGDEFDFSFRKVRVHYK